MRFLSTLLQMSAVIEPCASGHVMATLHVAIVVAHDAATVTEGHIRDVALHLQSPTGDSSRLVLETMRLRNPLLLVRRPDLQPGPLTVLCGCRSGPDIANVLLPSSKEHRQLNSLLCSLLKLCMILHDLGESEPVVGYDVMRAATIAVELLDVKQTIPLQVLGESCCLYWAEQLWQQLPGMLQHLTNMPQPRVVKAAAASTWRRSPLTGSSVLDTCRAPYVCCCGDTLECLPQMLVSWLQKQHVVRQLSSAGYTPEHLVQQLHTLLAARKAALDRTTADSARGPLVDVVCELHAVGMALSALAVPLFCNNPGCRNMSRLTELQQVSGRSAICAGCRTARYCSKQCQRLHWKQHKPVCKALAAAYAANNTAGSQ